MKKFFGCLFILCSLLLSLWAQDSDIAESELNEQYETFSWAPVAKAKEYEVVIQKQTSEPDTWDDYKSVKTKETSLEILFTPGTYRVALATYNLIGRRGKQTQWVVFQILEEQVPYLNDRFLPRSRFWNVPVLVINRNGKGQVSQADDSDFITNPSDYSGSNLLIKGRNIFSPKTEFYLIPKDDASEESQPFVNYCNERREQKLKVVQRNSKEFSVVVSYDAAALYPGYYSLEVRNSDEYKDSIDILVLDNTELSIQPQKGFEIDEHYNVNSFTIGSSDTYDFSLDVKDVSSRTSFYLEPVTGAIPYPFETTLERQKIPLVVNGFSKKEDSSAELNISCPVENIRTGYYNLIAENDFGETSKFICLVKKPFERDLTKSVKTLKTKFNKKTEYVDLTLSDDNFSINKTYTLVSQYDEALDSNKKIQLVLSPSGKKLVGKLSPDELTIARYALMVEDSYTSDVVYCNIDNTLKISQNKMSDKEIEKTFFRPSGGSTKVTLDADDVGSIQFTDNKVEMIKRMPFLFTNFTVNMSMLADSSTIIEPNLDLLNFGFIALTAGYECRLNPNGDSYRTFAVLKLALPNIYVQPYIGVGIGQHLVLPDNGVNDFETFKDVMLNKNEAYVLAQAGVLLFTIIDMRYNLYLNNVFAEPYFTDSFSVGFTFPLRAYKFKRKVVSRSAQITKLGVVDVTQFLEPDSNVDEVKICAGSSVTGFEGFDRIESVTIDESVEIVEQDAFRNCRGLEDVFFTSPYNKEGKALTIKKGAFSYNPQLAAITLPYRTSVVESDAFAGWTDGQVIRLAWNSFDTTPRDLHGLEQCSATVIYNDEQVFKGSYKTPLNDADNWIDVEGFVLKPVSVLVDDNYTLGLKYQGYGSKWYRTELYTWINQDTPQPALNYIKSGNSISFKVVGDGNKYDFVIVTQDGGYFYYRFKTQNEKTTTIEIPYKKFKKFNFSSESKLDMDKIKMIWILPMCKEEWNDVTFFDFEVK